MLHSVDGLKHLVEMPLVAWLCPSTSELISIRFPELIAPAPDCFVAQLYSPECHHQLDITKAYTEVEVKPDALGNDFFRKPIATVGVGRHSISISSAQCDNAAGDY